MVDTEKYLQNPPAVRNNLIHKKINFVIKIGNSQNKHNLKNNHDPQL